MKKRNALRFTAVALLALTAALLTLTGCSSDGGATSVTGPSASSTPTNSAVPGIPDTASIVQGVTKDSALAAKVPSELQSKGTMIIGSYVAAPPNNFYGPDGTTPVGLDVDIITAINNRLGLRTQYQDMSFDSIITAVKSGRVDASISEMNDTKERQQAVDFVDYFMSGISIMVQKGNPSNINSSDDLSGKKVAVVTGTTQEAYVHELSDAFIAAGKAAVEITATDSLPQNQTQLRTGRIDAILADLPAAVYTATTAGDGELFEVVDQAPINGGPYGIAVPKDDPALTTAIQQSLQSLVDDGTYAKILDAWNISLGGVKEATINGG